MTTNRGESRRWRPSAAKSLSVAAGLAIVGLSLGLSVFGALPAISDEKQWVPFVFCLVGVTLYTLSSVKRRRERFDFSYFPDYTYRAAQAVVYLYIILAILKSFDTATELTNWPPNLIGLLVGLFILRVEKAMDGLGQKFEEVLTTILGRRLAMPTAREKDAERVRAEGRLREIRQQAEVLAAQTGQAAMLEGLKTRLDEVNEAIGDDDHGAIVKKIQDLSLDFETAKHAVRREELTVQEVLGQLQSLPAPPEASRSRARRKEAPGR